MDNVYNYKAFIGLLAADVAGQFTAAPPTCSGSTFTFRCTVTGDMNGVTIWRVGGNSECPLPHRSNSSSICGPSNVFTARSSTGFGTSATSYSSTLSGTATPALDGTMVECFQQAASLDPQSIINGTTLTLLGQYVYFHKYISNNYTLLYDSLLSHKPAIIICTLPCSFGVAIVQFASRVK